jgi:hypothetical protein
MNPEQFLNLATHLISSKNRKFHFGKFHSLFVKQGKKQDKNKMKNKLNKKLESSFSCNIFSINETDR